MALFVSFRTGTAPASSSNASQYASSAQGNKEVYSSSSLARCGVSSSSLSRWTRKASLRKIARRKSGFLFQGVFVHFLRSLTWCLATILYNLLSLLRWLFGAEDR